MPSLAEALQEFTTVILTGGSSGIGKSFIKRCAELNPNLVVCNLSRRAPAIIYEKLKLRHFPCDLGEKAAVAETAKQLEEFIHAEMPTGRVLLVNNSGFGAYGHFPEPNVPHLMEMVDVNVRAVVELTARLLPLLKTRGGAIVTVASTAAFQPTAFMATYGASKAFVLHWSLALNEELRGSGVRTLVVCPGPTATEFHQRAGLHKGSVSDAFSMSCEQVVDATLEALAAGRSLVVPGWKNKVAACLGSMAPKRLAAWMAAKVLVRYLKKVSR